MNPVVNILSDIVTYGLEKVGLYYSKYRGFVYDRNDPEGYGRLLVSVPEVYGDMVPKVWAWPASNYSGTGYGAQALPKRNDLIWVEFEKGNLRKPLWSYGYFGKGQKPDELKDVDNYWFKTPAGHLVELNDTDSLIRITHADGKTIELSTDTLLLLTDAVTIKEDSVQLLDGSCGGLTKVQETADKISAVETKVNDILNILVSTSIPLAPSGTYPFAPLYAAVTPITPTTAKADLENTKVTHGE
jgi:hypothetical protein